MRGEHNFFLILMKDTIKRVFPVSLREKVRSKKLTSVIGLINQRRTTDVAENSAQPEGSSTTI